MFSGKSLPPMSTLRPFEAAARHLSFSKAADEICVTQAAVSKQIRMLETFLGKKLFIRRGRNVEITGDGEVLHQAVAQGLAGIAQATARIRLKRETGRVSMAMRLPFASQFMASRITDLRKEFNDIDLNIVSTERNPFFLLDTVDMAVVLGYEPQPDLVADYLLTEEIFPVCSPAYAERHPELRAAKDIPDQTLLHLGSDHWRELAWEPVDWPVLARALGAEREVTLDGLTFNNHEMLMSAAVSGVGMAVAWQHLCKDLLEQGHLIRPIEGSYRIDRKHYLVTHAGQAGDPVIERLRQWFVSETACFRD